MPFYDYKCPNCEHEFEAMHKMSDPKPPCPNCGHKEVDTKIHPVANVQFYSPMHPNRNKGRVRR